MKNKMINTKAKIHCHSCGKDFNIYWVGLNKIDSCPHCNADIDETMWESILKSIAQVQQTNQDFYKYNLERKEPMFTISIEGLCTELAEEQE
ncbi:hypothetical protein [Candidatus Clostridium helianthi]|uniref:Uncharacterized protein n=1 Tax=Candidatus Clostridium helianthi TaxID=3381660 RepID=A0ABW8S5B4_9CLOT